MRLRQQSLFDSNFQEEPFFKDQENPNFSAFDTSESLTNNPVFEPGRLGKRSDGTKISKLCTDHRVVMGISEQQSTAK